MASATGSLNPVKPYIHSLVQSTSSLSVLLLGMQEGAMETARLTFKQTMKRLDRVAKKTRSNHVIYVFLFGFALFMAFYFWTKVYRFLKWIL